MPTTTWATMTEALRTYYERTHARAAPPRSGRPPIRRAATLLGELEAFKARHSCTDPACRLCHPDLPTAGWAPSTPEEWAGVARMATARRAAGVALSARDLEALERAAR